MNENLLAKEVNVSLKKILIFAFLIAFLTIPVFVFAAGPHDPNCIECHSIHDAKGARLIAVTPLAPNNPSTGSTLTGGNTLCLGCHSDEGGVLPIDLMKTHPVGMKPVKVLVPGEVLDKDGTLRCMSCHDPHPANANYKYLVVNTNDGDDMGAFCGYCHTAQVEKE